MEENVVPPQFPQSQHTKKCMFLAATDVNKAALCLNAGGSETIVQSDVAECLTTASVALFRFASLHSFLIVRKPF